MKKVLAIIPARGGSKGILKKNIVLVKGKPLVYWTIGAAVKSKFIDDIVVSSDSDEILDKCSCFNEVILHKRAESLSQDHTPTYPVLENVLEFLGKDKYEYIILLQPTSPLRTSNHIDEAFEQMINEKSTAIISGYEPSHHPMKSFYLNEGLLKGTISNTHPFLPRQELPVPFQPNGAIYIVNTKLLLTNESLFTSKTSAYFMSKSSSLDIDTLKDLENINGTL